MDLTAENVRQVILACFYADDELPENPSEDNLPEGAVITRGVRHMVFHPQRLEEHRDEVRSMLLQLPDEFMRSKGGGWSLLQAVTTKEGGEENLWGQQIDADALMCLGMGLGLVESQLPRGAWKALPGGLPYYVVNDE